MTINTFSSGVNTSFSSELNSNFSQLGTWYVEDTDSSGSPITHSTTTPTLKRTFAFTGLTADYHITSLELEDISITDSSSNGSDRSYLGIIITDGTNYYSPYVPSGSDTDLPADYRWALPTHWDVVSAGTPSRILSCGTSPNETATIDRISIPIPVGMLTGATSYSVLIYLWATQTAANTVTLQNAFTVRLVFDKIPRDLGTSVSQS